IRPVYDAARVRCAQAVVVAIVKIRCCDRPVILDFRESTCEIVAIFEESGGASDGLRFRCDTTELVIAQQGLKDLRTAVVRAVSGHLAEAVIGPGIVDAAERSAGQEAVLSIAA